MYFAKRQNKDGTVTFRFTYIDPETGKRKRLPQSAVPHLETEAEARAWAKSQQAIQSARRAHIEAKLNWRKKYYDFQKLLDLYSKWQQARAPNSWKSNVYYLEQWVFPYFLLEQRNNNCNNWHLQARQFVDWLQTDEAAIKKERPAPLAASPRATSCGVRLFCNMWAGTLARSMPRRSTPMRSLWAGGACGASLIGGIACTSGSTSVSTLQSQSGSSSGNATNRRTRVATDGNSDGVTEE
jgi:hypothetical protein